MPQLLSSECYISFWMFVLLANSDMCYDKKTFRLQMAFPPISEYYNKTPTNTTEASGLKCNENNLKTIFFGGAIFFYQKKKD